MGKKMPSLLPHWFCSSVDADALSVDLLSLMLLLKYCHLLPSYLPPVQTHLAILDPDLTNVPVQSTEWISLVGSDPQCIEDSHKESCPMVLCW